MRKALFSVSSGKSTSLRKAADENDLSYSFLYRRWSGEVDLYKVKGPTTIFSEAEEEKMALWLSEMAQRGLGLRMFEFLDFVEDIVKREKRNTPFKNGRPGKKWYYAFMQRNKHIISSRTETDLEMKRSKVTKEKTDLWYSKFRDFLIENNLIEAPSRIWNADEAGFNMGSNKSKVIGPSRKDLNVPHITSGKQRLTVMFCGNAAGQMMPPYFIYPEPKPKGYNPLNGALEGSDIAFTKKGWMNNVTFSKFIDHFDKHAGRERPVVLLFDSVSIHIDPDLFVKGKDKGIEMYRIVPNATHLMQPLDKGVFGPLKTKWHITCRKFTRENPGKCIGKENFAQKLTEAYLQFYRPLTVMNAFKSSGIYPVDSTVITSDMLKPALTYSDSQSSVTSLTTAEDGGSAKQTEEQVNAKGALAVFEESLSTPAKERYTARINEGYDIEGKSPCFDVYKKLHMKANPSQPETPTCSDLWGLQILADAAMFRKEDEQPGPSSEVSPVILESLKLPKAATEQLVPTRQTMTNILPDNLTSTDSIRKCSLKQLNKVKMFAEKERRAKQLYLKKKLKAKAVKGKKGPKPQSKKGKRPLTESEKLQKLVERSEEDECCQACHMTYEEDEKMGLGRVWVECDSCKKWMHPDCLNYEIDDMEPFLCPNCSK